MLIDTHRKNKWYRWIGLVIGLFLGLIIGYFAYYNWVKKEAGIYFQKNIGEVKFITEYQKWAMKNPFQAREIAIKIQKELGMYEELKSETNPEIIQQKIMTKIEQMNDDEKKEINKKMVKIYEEHAPSFVESLDKEFPWYLRYCKTIFLLILLAVAGSGFWVGYLLEPKEEILQ